jgi:CDP-glucose 4,6-dehydratase
VGGGDWTPWQLVPEVMTSFRDGNKVTLRHPDAIRPWQHVLDCLSGYLLLAEKLHADPESYSGEWNFGPAAKDTYSVADVVEMLARYWGIADGWELDDRSHSHEAATLSLDSSKAREQLQWQPKLTTEMALEWVADWYKSYFSSGSARELCRGQIEHYMAL